MTFYSIYIINYIALQQIDTFQIGLIGCVHNQEDPTSAKEIGYSLCSIRIIREDTSAAIDYPSILRQSKRNPHLN